MFIKKLFSICIIIFSVTCLFSQSKYTISGYITDKESGEGLIGANIIDVKSGSGTVTNTYGFYSLTLKSDSIYVAYSYIGYQTLLIGQNLVNDLSVDVQLIELNTLDAVEIIGERAEKIEEKTQMSTIGVPIAQLRKIPALLGETDILKALQLLPGVQSGGEGQSGFYVRGGSADQNLILLDGTPVYNASHLFGFFSVFNVDAIKDVTLVKGGFPARYGGRLSSVLDINMKEGNLNKFHGSGSLGIISSKFTLEGPIVKDKAAFIISARRTYLDILAKPFVAYALRSEGDGTTGSLAAYFYDLNAKVNWKISSKDRIYLSAYSGRDQFRIKSGTSSDFNEFTEEENLNFGFGWGNLTSALRWNHLWTDKLFSNTTLTYSNYNFGNEVGIIDNSLINEELINSNEIGFGYVNGINDYTAKIDFDYIPAPKHFVKFGVNATRHKFIPGEFNLKFKTIEDKSTTIDIDSIFGQKNVVAYETSAYIEDDYEITSKLKANVGLHFASFFVNGKQFHSLQPRLAARYLLPRNISAKASFATMQQNIQYLTNENIGLPSDQWLPTTDRIVPQKSWQVAAGFAKTINDDYEVSVEAYYKHMENVSSFKEGASLFQFNDWEDQITQGQGRSYGAEFFLQKKTGKFSGWIGYTLSWSERRFDDKNFGAWYPFTFDRRHDISIVAIYDISKRWSISGTWVYGTGNAYTLANSSYFIDRNGYPNEINNINERNNYRLNPFHRADFNADYSWGKKRMTHKLSMGAYNLYGRKNPFFVNPETRGEFDPQTGQFTSRNVLVQYSLFRFIPSMSYSFTF